MRKNLVEKTAKHEAAHAVMRWVLGMTPTPIELNPNGGCCFGSSATVQPQDQLLVTLAGFAWESGCGIAKIDFATSHTADFDDARSLLISRIHLRSRIEIIGEEQRIVFDDVDESLNRWFRTAGEMLLPYLELVDELGEQLLENGRLSSDQIAAIIRTRDRS